MLSLLCLWYVNKLVIVAFLAAAAIAVWIFYDSQRKFTQATVWRALSAAGAVLILPSLLASFFDRLHMFILRLLCMLGDILPVLERLPSEGIDLGELGVGSAAELQAMGTAAWGVILGNLPLFMWLGIGGLLLALAAAVGYFMGAREMYPAPEPLPPTVSAPSPLPTAPPPRATPSLERTKLVGEPPPVTAWLVVQSGPLASKQLGLGTGRNIIGRDGNRSDLVLDDASVSAQHAQVRYEHGQFVIHDLASTNGTFVNNRRIQRQPLMDNDVIRLGSVALVFKTVGRSQR